MSGRNIPNDQAVPTSPFLPCAPLVRQQFNHVTVPHRIVEEINYHHIVLWLLFLLMVSEILKGRSQVGMGHMRIRYHFRVILHITET